MTKEEFLERVANLCCEFEDTNPAYLNTVACYLNVDPNSDSERITHEWGGVDFNFVYGQHKVVTWRDNHGNLVDNRKGFL